MLIPKIALAPSLLLSLESFTSRNKASVFFKICGNVELRFDQSGSENHFDVVNGRLDTLASVEGFFTVSKLDGLIVTF